MSKKVNYDTISDLEQLFSGSTPSDFLVKETKKESDFFSPSPKFSKNGKNYICKIKFIPFIQNPKSSIISKWVIYLQNPNLGDKYIDCPSTVNQPSILQQLYFALDKSENSADKKLAEKFSRRKVYFSLVQIISDDNKPELEGKIKIFKFGQKLYNRLDKLMNPKRETKQAPHNPFDIFNGRTLDLDIKIKAGYNDYEDSEFSINPEPTLINGEILTKNSENFKKAAEWILENSPDLLQIQFKPWDNETWTYVLDTINEVVPNARLIEQLYKKNNINNISKPQTTKLNKTISTDLNEDTDDDEDPPFDVDEQNEINSKRQATFNQMKNKLKKVEELDIDDSDEIDEVEAIMSSTSKKAVNSAKKSKPAILDDDDLYAGL